MAFRLPTTVRGTPRSWSSPDHRDRSRLSLRQRVSSPLSWARDDLFLPYQKGIQHRFNQRDLNQEAFLNHFPSQLLL